MSMTENQKCHRPIEEKKVKMVKIRNIPERTTKIKLENTKIKILHIKRGVVNLKKIESVEKNILNLIEKKLYFSIAYMITLVFPTNYDFKEEEKEELVKKYMKILIKTNMFGVYVKEQASSKNEHYHVIVCIMGYDSYFKINAERNWYKILEEKVYGIGLNGEMLKLEGYKHLYKFEYIKNKERAIAYLLKELWMLDKDDRYKLKVVAYIENMEKLKEVLKNNIEEFKELELRNGDE